MKYIAMAALMLNLGGAGLYAHERPIRMTFSGTAGTSAINLQYPNNNTGEDNFAGNGNLGSFTFREVESNGGAPQQSSTCSGATQLYFTLSVGAGVLRFGDGSLLTVMLTEGADCIDFSVPQAHCTRTFKITGGSGRFKQASGTLYLDETLIPVLADALNMPVLFASDGVFTGTISGVARAEERDDQR